MAQTKAGKKRVFVHAHERKGYSVRQHYRSTPNQKEKHGGGLASLFSFFMSFGKKNQRGETYGFIQEVEG